MSLDHSADQRERCSCCGEYLGPEHIPGLSQAAQEELRHQVETLTYDLRKARERDQEVGMCLADLKQARKAGNGYLGAQAVKKLEGLADE